MINIDKRLANTIMHMPTFAALSFVVRGLKLFWASDVILILLAGLSVDSQAAALSFSDAQALALKVAPALLSQQAQIDTARHLSISASALPDPKLSLGVDNYAFGKDDPTKTAHGDFNLNMTDYMKMQYVGISQAVPNPYKLIARNAAAEGNVELAEAQARLGRLQILQETAIAWIARNTVERQAGLLAELDHENALFEEVLRAQFAGGSAIPVDLLAPKQEAALIAERRDELNSRKARR